MKERGRERERGGGGGLWMHAEPPGLSRTWTLIGSGMIMLDSLGGTGAQLESGGGDGEGDADSTDSTGDRIGNGGVGIGVGELLATGLSQVGGASREEGPEGGGETTPSGVSRGLDGEGEAMDGGGGAGIIDGGGGGAGVTGGMLGGGDGAVLGTEGEAARDTDGAGATRAVGFLGTIWVLEEKLFGGDGKFSCCCCTTGRGGSGYLKGEGWERGVGGVDGGDVTMYGVGAVTVDPRPGDSGGDATTTPTPGL